MRTGHGLQLHSVVECARKAERQRDEAQAKCAIKDQAIDAALGDFEMINKVARANGLWLGHPFTQVPALLTQAREGSPGQKLLDELKTLQERNERLERVREATQELKDSGFCWPSQAADRVMETLAACKEKP